MTVVTFSDFQFNEWDPFYFSIQVISWYREKKERKNWRSIFCGNSCLESIKSLAHNVELELSSIPEIFKRIHLSNYLSSLFNDKGIKESTSRSKG